MTHIRPLGVVPITEEPASPEVGVSGDERAPLVLSARRAFIYEVHRADPLLSCGVFSTEDNARRYIDDQEGTDFYVITERTLDVAGSRRVIT